MLNLELISEGGGYGIAMTGMVIVFSGLLGLSIFIGLLPRILAKVHEMDEARRGLKNHSHLPSKNPTDSNGTEANAAVLAAIAYVIDAERKWLMSDDVKALHQPQASSWSLSDKMRTFPTRTNP